MNADSCGAAGWEDREETPEIRGASDTLAEGFDLSTMQENWKEVERPRRCNLVSDQVHTRASSVTRHIRADVGREEQALQAGPLQQVQGPM